ncbi:MAG TPA: chromate efflux transporter [Candidatus Limnocylindrales bacterium]|nr:chromate efflux transporter [Candidatus Limnocylindrales bacterium]
MNVTTSHRSVEPSHGISFAEAARVWARVAALSFGGPAGQIAVMHRILVDEKKWIGDARFLHALNYCMLLPGPEAQQLAVYIGWLLHRTAGGLVAGLLFILPGFVSIMALSIVYAAYGNVGSVAALFFGMKAAVLAVVIEAVQRVGKRSLKSNEMRAVAVAAFIAVFVFDVAFPWIVLAAGLIGFAGARLGVRAFAPGAGGHGAAGSAMLSDADSALGESMPAHARPSTVWSLRMGTILLLLWLVPVILIVAMTGDRAHSAFADIAVFFSKMAVVTFGGAYAVLTYVAQQAVTGYGWLRATEMMDGLGMAETTPGPLIMVNQFVGFLAAFRNPGMFPPYVAGVLGAILTVWVTFTPCFLWIFLGAPYVETLRSNKALSGALATITAAVVGMIANLAVWFALHVMFREVHVIAGYGATIDVPVLASINVWSVVLFAGAAWAIFRAKKGMLGVLAVTALAGMLLYFAGLVQPIASSQ